MRPASIVAFAVTFLALSSVADKSAMFAGLSFVSRDKASSVTGAIAEWRAGESIAVHRDRYSPGLAMTLRPNTVYEGNASTIKVGVRVTVWYRNVSERRMVVEKVRVLDR
jgi:hypothetical protein